VEVEIEDDEEPYETARAVDSDDDRYVGTTPLTEEEMEIGASQLQGAPSTQESQPPAQRARHPRDCYTPGTDALGRKGKGKTRRQ
jgi:hypothetical protein